MANLKSNFILAIAILIRRNLEIPLKSYRSQYPVIAIVGPRQSGKTTLAREFFKDYAYVSLENLDLRFTVNELISGVLDTSLETILEIKKQNDVYFQCMDIDTFIFKGMYP